MLGLVSSYAKSIQFYEMKTREWQLVWYFRDRWQATRRLTMNLGLRYEYYPLINRGDRGIERWDPETNIAYFGGLGNTPWNAGIDVSKRLFSPRIGLAYRIAEDLVFRVGYGLTYDPLPFGRPLRGLYPSTLTGSWSATVSTYGWYNQIDQGIPAIATPDVSKGYTTLPLNIDMGPRSPWGGMLHRGYIQSWNATLERKLPFDMLGSIGYVATRTIHQMIDRNINSVGPGESVSLSNLPLAKTQGRTINMSMWDGIGISNYHSLQALLNKHFTKGLMARVSYTFGKSLSMADEDGYVSLPYFNWSPVLRRNYAPSGYDRTHMFTAGWNYEIPVGKGKKYAIENKITDAIAGGWKLSGIFVAYSGLPFTVSGSSSSLQANGNSQTADQIAEVKKLGGKGPGNPYYDPMSFRDPLWEYATTKVYRFGTTGRNILRGPGYWQISPAIFKNFKVGEKINAEFRAESTNFTNTPIWSTPSGSSASLKLNSSGQRDPNVADSLQNFMCITSATAGRTFRFGLRIAF